MRAIFCSIATATMLVGASIAQFETRGSNAVLTEPYSVALGDFNHDGVLDMAVASPFTNVTQISVLLGNGDGTFKPAVAYAAGASPFSVAAADLNGDGNLDLAVADGGSASIAILIGNGNGTFQAPKNFNIPNPPTFVAVADFNNDHKLDLVVTDKEYVSVLLGNGDGTFQSPINSTPTHQPVALAFGEFNSDNNLDVVVAQQDISSQIQVLLGNGDGTFQLGNTFSVDSDPSSIAVGDFRGIGKQDLAVACLLGRGVDVLLGKGDGTFQAPVTYPDASSYWVTVADLNGDGKLDMAVANFDLTQHNPSAAVSTLIGNGDGTFQKAVLYPAGKTDTFVAVGDFNGDKQPDVAVADRLSSEVFVVLNTGVVNFSPTTPIAFPTQLYNTTSAPQTIKLTNTGTTALTISSMKASGEFGLTSTCGSSVPAGATCNLNVTFSPTTKGPKSGLITIHDGASTKPQVIELSGQGTVVTLAPPSLSFGTQKVHTQSAPQTVTLTNQGTSLLSITKIFAGGTDWTDFSTTSDCPASLGAGAHCTISVTFDPTQKGTRKANVSAQDNGGGSPQTIPISGTGD